MVSQGNTTGDGSTVQAPVVIIGAGLAGLAAAVLLERHGHPVRLLEAADGVGGRVRSDRTADGYVLDRGFQVLFTGYPALTGLVDQRALRLRRFDAGARIAGCSPMQVAVDPFAHPTRLPGLLANSPFSLGDDLRILRLKLELMGPSRSRLNRTAERSAAAELAALGLSQAAIERFFRPFFGGIFLDRCLGVRAAWLLFVFKMLSEGSVAVPEAGMGELSEHLAAKLRSGAVHLNTRVTALESDEGGRVTAVLAGARRYAASAVILATDIWSAAELHPDVPSLDPVGCTTMYFSSDTPLYRDRLLVLNPNSDGFLNEAVQLTNIAPSYAPRGKHLLSCTSLVAQSLDDATIEQRSRAELRQWFGARADALHCLGMYRIQRSQFAQPPHWRERRPAIRTDRRGLYLAGEYLQSSSIQGALSSGVQAAHAVMEDGGSDRARR